MGTLFAPFVRDVLHGSGQDYGLIVSVQAVGGIVGGVVAASLGQRVSPVTMFGAGAIVFGLVDLVMFLYPLVFVEIWPAVVCMVVVGVPGAVTIVGLTTLLQRHTTDAYRGRVFGAWELSKAPLSSPARSVPGSSASRSASSRFWRCRALGTWSRGPSCSRPWRERPATRSLRSPPRPRSLGRCSGCPGRSLTDRLGPLVATRRAVRKAIHDRRRPRPRPCRRLRRAVRPADRAPHP
jgi:hypothetical protein